MVGIRQPSSGANVTLPFTVADTAFVPNEFTGRITDDWASVPWCAADFTNYGDPAVDHLADVHSPANGIGDICRHMGVIDGANWRMPTQSEWIELYGSDQINGVPPVIHGAFGEGSFTPLSGQSFGPNRNIVTIVSDIEVANADPNTNGAVFFPACGYRAWNNGDIYSIGSGGYYWSSTAFTHANSLLMKFYSTNVLPQYSDVRTYGLSIRCIRE